MGSFADRAGTPTGYSRDELTEAEARASGTLLPERTVVIEVRPGDPVKWIAPCSPLELPVAIFGESDLDVTQIDPGSIQLGGALATDVDDVDGDGNADLTASFAMSQIGVGPGATTVGLAARTDAGQLLLGTDGVVVVPNSSPPDW